MTSTSSTRQLGLRHAFLVFASPRRVFALVEDTGAYGWALVTLIVLTTLIGYAKVQTGLIDAVVDRRTEVSLAELEEAQTNLVDRVQLADQMEAIRKAGEFTKTMSRLGAMVATPMALLASYLLIASVLYAAVAMTGRKPEYHTLMAICVYAGFMDLLAYALRLAMMVYYSRIDVDTTLASLTPDVVPNWLAAVDPFRIWFWVLVAVGLTVTRQLRTRGAVAICVFLGLVGAGGRVALSLAQGA